MAVTFIDGPAVGSRLELQRTPIFLRVVIDAKRNVDALDLLTDEPTPTETLYAYHYHENLGRGWICSRGKGCQAFVECSYKLHTEQPADAIMRDPDKWAAWTHEQYDKEQSCKSKP